MCKSIIKLFCFIGFLFCGKHIYSQTTTFDYLKSNLSTSACNVFNPSVNVNSVAHSSRSGGVSFNVTDGLRLFTTPKASPQGGTAFVINYNFIPENNFDISITAKGKDVLFLKTSVVPNFNQFTTNSTTACTPDPNVSSYNTVREGRLSAATSTTSATYNIPQFSIQGSAVYPYLILWVSGGNTSLDLDVLTISQIVITKTTPLQMSPSSVPINCGYPITQSFSLNSSGVTGITGYTWNLGTTPNGWIYNGNPAPQTIITSSNTLQLSSACISTSPKNVSATVLVNNAPLSTATSTVIFNAALPSFTVNGSSSICNSTPTTYNIIEAFPCNANITWTASPTGIVNLTPTGNTVQLIKTGNGNVVLTATISSVCGIKTAIKVIELGTQTASNIIGLYPPLGVSPGELLELSVGENGTSYQWNVEGGVIHGSSNQSFVTVQVDQCPPGLYNGYINVYCTITNGCGTGNTYSEWTTIDCSTYSVSPNPSNGVLTVESKLKNKLIKEIKIMDKSGNIKQQIKYTGKDNKVIIDVSSLPQNIYSLLVFDGKIWSAIQISIKR